MVWEKVKLGDIAESIQTGPFGSQLHQSDYVEKGTPVVMPKDLVNGKISDLSIARVSQENVERLKRYKIDIGDILYSRRGDVGKCAFTTEIEKNWLCGTGCLKVTVDKYKANSKFVFYQLQRPEIIGWVINHAVGSTMLNLNTSILSNVPIEIPPIATQTKIANILSAYDNLIENNQKQIKLLEEAAQRLYKEWFVDFRFPGHENTEFVDGLPSGWKKLPIKEVFSWTRGRSYTSQELSETEGIKLVNLKNIKAFGGYNRDAEKRFTGNYKEEQLLFSGDVIMGVTDMTKERRLVGHVAIIPNLKEPATFSMDLIKLLPKCVTKSFLYSILFYGGYSRKISQLANGTNVLHLKPESIETITLRIPDKEIMLKYDEIFTSYNKKMELLEDQIMIASEARDRLLPKLMSGEISLRS